MTIAISVKVHDGVVLAADSASTLTGVGPNGETTVLNVYNNANKIVNLRKGMPVGVVTWGAGAIGPASITTVFKDIREMFSGRSLPPDGSDWTIQDGALDVGLVAERVKSYIYDHLYVNEFGAGPGKPEMGMVVAGYSSGAAHAEEYRILIDAQGQCSIDALNVGPTCGITVGGQPQTISRLVLGIDPAMQAVLEGALGVSPTQSGQAVALLQQHLQLPVVQDPMPFKDAIDLTEFLVNATIQMSRFLPGPATVGGPIEIAAISKHEGFKWVSRKHYYDSSFNPKECP